MPNTHAFVNTSSCAFWDVDAWNRSGVAEVDFDNACLVSLGNITRTAQNAITGFHFAVTGPAANATNLWLVKTPVPGTSTSMDVQMFSDPRYFYNKAGETMSLGYLMPKDVIEVPAEAFTDGSAPSDQPTYGFASVTTTTGKLAVANAAPGTGTYFTILGTHTVSIGQDIVTTYMLQCERN